MIEKIVSGHSCTLLHFILIFSPAVLGSFGRL